MPILPVINHHDAIRTLAKAGFRVERQGKHVIMSDGFRVLTIPRNDPIHAVTMGKIVRDAGLTIDQFRELI